MKGIFVILGLLLIGLVSAGGVQCGVDNFYCGEWSECEKSGLQFRDCEIVGECVINESRYLPDMIQPCFPVEESEDLAKITGASVAVTRDNFNFIGWLIVLILIVLIWVVLKKNYID